MMPNEDLSEVTVWSAFTSTCVLFPDALFQPLTGHWRLFSDSLLYNENFIHPYRNPEFLRRYVYLKKNKYPDKTV